MVRQPRYLLNRNGRYFARLVIPKGLRPFLEGKTELREALGPDRRVALSYLHTAVARLQGQIAVAERRAKEDSGAPIEAGRYPLPPEQIALRNYNERLAFDAELRKMDERHAMGLVDDRLVELLRAGVAGALDDETLQTLVGRRIERYRRLGNTTALKGSAEWRSLARAMCVSELEALARVVERDEGDFSGKPEHPLLAELEAIPEEEPPVPLRDLFDRYVTELKANGKGIEAEKRWRPVLDDLIAFARTMDARKLTKKTILEWKDAKLKNLSPRTVKDVYLTAINAVLNWAVSNDLLEDNPAKTVKLRVAPKAQLRPKGFTREEATRILKFTLSYVARQSGNPQTQEKPQTSAAKKWASLICAFTGARISEVTQLRKQDIRLEGGVYVMRIAPDAGKVKTRQYRDVPLHDQIIAKGFIDFVNGSDDGPLFYPVTKGKRAADPAQTVAGRIHPALKTFPDVGASGRPEVYNRPFPICSAERSIASNGDGCDRSQVSPARTTGAFLPLLEFVCCG
jgi:integrase